MAIKIISNDLLQFVVRGSFLEPLVEIMPQVLVESAPDKRISHLENIVFSYETVDCFYCSEPWCAMCRVKSQCANQVTESATQHL